MRLTACRRLVMGCALGCGLAVVSSLANATVVPPAYFDAASLHQVPPEVLYAVATAESVVSLKVGRRPWPWTLNVAGEGFHFATRQAACDALVLALQETRVVDVGIAQLNVRWQPQLFGASQRFADNGTAARIAVHLPLGNGANGNSKALAAGITTQRCHDGHQDRQLNKPVKRGLEH